MSFNWHSNFSDELISYSNHDVRNFIHLPEMCSSYFVGFNIYIYIYINVNFFANSFPHNFFEDLNYVATNYLIELGWGWPHLTNSSDNNKSISFFLIFLDNIFAKKIKFSESP